MISWAWRRVRAVEARENWMKVETNQPSSQGSHLLILAPWFSSCRMSGQPRPWVRMVRVQSVIASEACKDSRHSIQKMTIVIPRQKQSSNYLANSREDCGLESPKFSNPYRIIYTSMKELTNKVHRGCARWKKFLEDLSALFCMRIWQRKVKTPFLLKVSIIRKKDKRSKVIKYRKMWSNHSG